MADRRDQEALRAVTPSRQLGQGREDIPEEGGIALADVTGHRPQVSPTLRLEADVQLAEVVEGRENAQAGPTRLIELAPSQAGEPPSPQRKPK
jgi:hypothetical protein